MTPVSPRVPYSKNLVEVALGSVTMLSTSTGMDESSKSYQLCPSFHEKTTPHVVCHDHEAAMIAVFVDKGTFVSFDPGESAIPREVGVGLVRLEA
eukprot:Skav236817  [mRNA]  locus=scaffold80:473435:482066:- [translate_table: standard]